MLRVKDIADCGDLLLHIAQGFVRRLRKPAMLRGYLDWLRLHSE